MERFDRLARRDAPVLSEVESDIFVGSVKEAPRATEIAKRLK
jgi:hypothetical protein